MSAGTGDLKIVGYQKIAGGDQREGRPVIVPWRWFDHFPGLALVGIVVLCVALPRENRRPQALLIFVPLLVLPIAWRMLARLLSVSPVGAEVIGSFVFSFGTGLACLWLIGHWLASQRAIVAMAIAVTGMACVGSLAYVCHFGSEWSEWMVQWLAPLWVAFLTVVFAISLSGYSCRHSYLPGRLMSWQLLWTTVLPVLVLPVVAILGAFVLAVGMTLTSTFDGAMITPLVIMAFMSIFFGWFFGVFIYLMNLPFMFLAVRSPFFHQRLQAALHLPQPVGPSDVTSVYAQAKKPGRQRPTSPFAADPGEPVAHSDSKQPASL